MTLSSTIDSNGQVVIPLAVRHHLGLKEGDRVEFVIDHDQIVMRAAGINIDPFGKYIGSLPAFDNKHQINKWVAGLREDDQK